MTNERESEDFFSFTIGKGTSRRLEVMSLVSGVNARTLCTNALVRVCHFFSPTFEPDYNDRLFVMEASLVLQRLIDGTYSYEYAPKIKTVFRAAAQKEMERRETSASHPSAHADYELDAGYTESISSGVMLVEVPIDAHITMGIQKAARVANTSEQALAHAGLITQLNQTEQRLLGRI